MRSETAASRKLRAGYELYGRDFRNPVERIENPRL